MRAGVSVRRGWIWLVAFAAVVAALAALLSWGGGPRTGPLPLAPAFTLPDLAGQPTALPAGDVALRFGSVNCTICDPDWDTLARWQAAPGAPRILAVEVGEPAAVVAVRLRAPAYPVPVLIDATGAVAQRYGVRSLPSFAFIDRAGRLVAVQGVETRTGIWGEATWQHYVGLLAQADLAVAGGPR